MKFELRKNCLAQVVAIALCGSFVSAAQAAPTVISGFGTTSATIDDAGYFSPAGALGLSFNGREFVNLGTFASNWSLNANSLSVAVADEVAGNNPLATTAFGAGGSISVVTNLGGGGGGWSLVETVSIPTSGHVAVQIQLTNNTGANATDVQWGVGIDPDQGVPAGLGFGTTNEILGLGNAAAVRATSLDGWSLTLANTTSASAFNIASYIDPFSCCSPVDPAAMLLAAQAIGSYGFSDSSINLAYNLGDIANGQSASFGYEYIMAVPEPETYAMLLAGLGLIGFSARRRSAV
ncbi:MAG: PEP-CTERM sorting domain-containing protein [Nitrosomonas sp.]|nr:PEP-CTERM sorting domain-containing protein [Nitrosomonas sp.]UJO99357.1 MAG: PEP-CTERM sorting domain-containing protein [Nitrosomonas sp.]